MSKEARLVRVRVHEARLVRASSAGKEGRKRRKEAVKEAVSKRVRSVSESVNQ